MNAKERDVHEWFLRRGLPLVLTRRVRSRALIERSAPAISGGALMALPALDADLTCFDPLTADLAVSLAGRDAYPELEDSHDVSGD